MAPARIIAAPATALALGVLALAALAGCKKPEPPLSAEPPPSITAHVRVLDADVLVIDGRHVRLANAYAPESTLRARCWAEALANAHAAEYVKDLVQHARSYEFKPTDETDEYNRTRGYVALDGSDLGDILYANGLAARPSKPRFDWCQPISQKAEGAPKLSTLYSVPN